MCGIVGVLSTEINSSNHSYSKFFQQALFADTLRGMDSTGVFLHNFKRQDQPEIFKKAMAAPDFLQLARSKDLLRDFNDWNIMIGHNRAATKGGVNHDTAHPFQYGDITLVHNGTIYNHRALRGGNKFDVDSEAVTHAIAEDGIDAVVEQLDGAFTLIYFDGSDGTLNVVRNSERPIALAQVANRETVLLSSESPMLRWIAMRNGMNLNKVVEPKPGELFTFKVDQDNPRWIEDATSRTLKLRPKYQQPSNNYGHNQGNVGRSGTSGKKDQTGGTTATPKADGSTSSGDSSGRKGPSESAMKLIQSTGLEYRDMVILSELAWQPYPKSKKRQVGFVTGVVDDLDMKSAYGLLHNVTMKEFRDMKDMYIYSEVCGAATDTQNCTVLYLDNTEYCTMEPEELPMFGSGNVSTVNYSDGDTDNPSDEEEKPDTATTFRIGAGEYVTAAGFAQLTAKGCSECGEPIDPKDHEKIGWTESKRCICKNCVKDLGLTQFIQ